MLDLVLYELYTFLNCLYYTYVSPIIINSVLILINFYSVSLILSILFFFFFSSRRRHTRLQGDWSSDVCSSDLPQSLDLAPVIEDRLIPDGGECRLGDVRAVVEGPPADLDAHQPPEHVLEIGRASCRERV